MMGVTFLVRYAASNLKSVGFNKTVSIGGSRILLPSTLGNWLFLMYTVFFYSR